MTANKKKCKNSKKIALKIKGKACSQEIIIFYLFLSLVKNGQRKGVKKEKSYKNIFWSSACSYFSK
jgi:hypothetical protein